MIINIILCKEKRFFKKCIHPTLLKLRLYDPSTYQTPAIYYVINYIAYIIMIFNDREPFGFSQGQKGRPEAQDGDDAHGPELRENDA